jgi:Mg-chelatase subunit ChlD
MGNQLFAGDVTEIVVIMDRSGSMASIWDDAVGGLQSLIEEQKEVKGKANFTLVAFDNDYEEFYSGQDLDTVPAEVPTEIHPRGGTALNDAIGKAIGSLKQRIDKSDDDIQVIVAIITDGQENSSKEWQGDKIKELITECQKELDWAFIFLGCNQDAIGVGRALGLSQGQTVNYAGTGSGTRSAYRGASKALGTLRSAKVMGMTAGAAKGVLEDDQSWKTEVEGSGHTAKDAKKGKKS